MSTADLRKVGSIDVLDLDVINKFDGRDFLPYPFMFTQPSKFKWHDDYVEYVTSVPDRFNHGDLQMFRECARVYANADIRVECHVADTPPVRVVAARCDQVGFLGKQRPDEDVVDIYEVSPYLLGPAVADLVALKKPGRRSEIVIPEYFDIPSNTQASDDVSIVPTTDDGRSGIRVSPDDVTAFGTVQSHWRPTRRWGLDVDKNYAVLVRIKDDGDYLYKPDFSAATPVTTKVLAERIDRLISEDVKAIRQFRSG